MTSNNIQNVELKHKTEYFLITVNIIEGRHYAWLNTDTAVIILINSKRKCTKVIQRTDNPYYNEYFTFEFFTTLEQLLDKIVILTVVRPSKIWRSNKILGRVSIDLATIWNQHNHQFFHKWAVLEALHDISILGPRGFLKLDIQILKKGEIPSIPLIDVKDTDEIENNLLVSESVTLKRQRANYVFKIYKGEQLCKPKYVHSINYKSMEKDFPSSFIEIKFVGIKVKTTIKRNTNNPVWNETLIITELFPPLCQRIKIKLVFVDICTIIADHTIDLRSISNAGENGFLPTFGPAFIDFYIVCGLSEGFVGRILISISTELQDNVMGPTELPSRSKLTTLDNIDNWNTEVVLLFAIIFNVNMISKEFSNKLISFEACFGNLKTSCMREGTNIPSNRTFPIYPATKTGCYCSLNYIYEKPCLFMTTVLPDFRYRIHNSNHILNILDDLKTQLNIIEELLTKRTKICYFEEIIQKLIDTIDNLLTSCRKYIDLVNSYPNKYETELDKQWKLLCIQEIKQIESTSQCLYDNTDENNSFKKLKKIVNKLELLIENSQGCWPSVFINMCCGDKRIAYVKFDSQQFTNSMVKEEKGKYCGKIQHSFLQTGKKVSTPTAKSTIMCHIELFLWIDLDKNKKLCLDKIPKGFQMTKFSKTELPYSLIADKFRYFQCCVHIFQGKLPPGFDKSGLCDAFVRVVIHDQCKETQVMWSTLNPVWDQTLIFQNISLCGSKKHIIRNPPLIILEVFDKDACNTTEYVGRSVIQPVIKFFDESYKEPKFPPKLAWYNVYNNDYVLGEVMATAECLEILELDTNETVIINDKVVINIPEYIKPTLVKYRLEVFFWGVRNLQSINLFPISKPKIVIECGQISVESSTIVNVTQSLNFHQPYTSIDINLPQEEEYAPAICLKMFDCRSFGRHVLAGNHLLSVHDVLIYPKNFNENECKRIPSIVGNNKNYSQTNETNQQHKGYSCTAKISEIIRKTVNQIGVLKKLFQTKRKRKSNKIKKKTFNEINEDDIDWWTKYYNSFEKIDVQNMSLNSSSSNLNLKIYPNELEKQREFNNFNDTLRVFSLYKGKRTGDETIDEVNIKGMFKGAIYMHQISTSNERNFVTNDGIYLSRNIFQNFPLNKPLKFLARIYCVRAINLRPKDINGKSDPYIILKMDNQIINDRKNYISKQVNPIFGKCFEMIGIFSKNHSITVSIWDWDLTTSDDLIGETTVDIENRYYSRHRGRCGMAKKYFEKGPFIWRDNEKPSQILEDICRRYDLKKPEYCGNQVKVGDKLFIMETENDSHIKSTKSLYQLENLALKALFNLQAISSIGFSLVPEYVETRSLYHPDKPGIEQGKIQLWIDIFPCGDIPPPPKVDITPRKPTDYELRLIVWNTEEITLDDENCISGEKTADIYVAGWLTSIDDTQFTDVHYRSLTGEGNFNWRFIFRFKYLKAENCIVTTKKESIFSTDETEYKMPCKLTLQVWDNDLLSTDDFLGTAVLELSRLPRGAATSKNCTLDILSPIAPKINLFKSKRIKGWWPFKNFDPETNNEVIAGKVELEFELLQIEEADKYPVGAMREEPHGLPLPNRPDTSYFWLTNPWRALKYQLKMHRRKCLKLFCFLFFIIFILLGLYALPGMLIKKVLHL